ncbi:transposase [Thermoanaerobacter sp. YS13]|uniref:transposase n=1 Tax=Thermoanaerobacter sp. YS13 TaxID=1511746 RepID=UPI0005757384|nr:transposase [Thermoanaerobacter sp. YS13]KHO62849.1 transposase [Thermoanaerobacter sp. YS13]
MAIIPQQTFFVWSEIENLGDLERLRLVLEYMPDEELMRVLEKERGKGRDDYPVRAMWNSILAGVVFEHTSIESLRRELLRNGQLRFMCGFRNGKVPGAYVYTRFLRKLFEKEEMINEIFNKLVDELEELLPGFGKNLAIDGKAISSFAKRENKTKREDGRRDLDADWGIKKYKGVWEDGTAWSKVVKWFGYRLHLIVDADYELPVAFEVTKASVSEIKQAHKIIDKLNERHAELIERCEILTADRGYDDTKLYEKLWDEYEIKPVIDLRNMWKDGEETRQLEDYENVVYNYKGNVYCVCMETGIKREMCVGGFEKDRKEHGTLKKLCPAKEYGIECKYMEKCKVKQGIRIDIKEDRRIFTPIDRASYKWKRYYTTRIAVERVNSRIDGSFGFERHYIRGKKKMKTRVGIALCVMLAMAVGRIKEKQADKMRSLVKSA